MMSEESFVFYPSWLRTIRKFDEESEERANKLARAIIEFGVTGEINTDDPIIAGVVDGMCREVMSKARSRRNATIKNGTGGGRPQEHSDEEFYNLHNRGLTNQEIADNLGCSVKTVERRLAKMDTEEIKETEL